MQATPMKSIEGPAIFLAQFAGGYDIFDFASAKPPLRQATMSRRTLV